MISVDEALNIVLDSVKPLMPETVTVMDAFGRVLAEDVYSDCDIPGFDYSAMDGYAVRYEDTKGASSDAPKNLKMVGEMRAGSSVSLRVGEGEAIKIMTGAPIPDGADAVVMVEHTEKDGETIRVFQEVEEGENIRRAGEDVKRGRLVINRGTRLREPHIGMLVALGRREVKVTRRPMVAILATGDEIVDIGEEMGYGKVRNANTYSLSCQVISAGGIPVNMGIAKDEPDELRRKLSLCTQYDIIITSGGVSMGEYDLVKKLLLELGMKQGFWKVAIRPGKPNLFGVIEGRPVFGLPGNPVSCMIGFELFVRPAILKMLCHKIDDRTEVEAYLEEDIKKKKGLRFFLRADTRFEGGRYVTRTTGPQGSGILSSMLLANSLIIIGEDESLLTKGSRVKVRFI